MEIRKVKIEERLYAASPSWARTIFMNLHGLRIERHRYGAPYRSELSRLHKLERASRAELDSYKANRLQLILRHASEKSPYYKALLSANHIDVSRISSLADVSRLPLLRKETLREQESAILTSPQALSGWMHGHTSGTTGSPLSLWYDRHTCVMTNAVDRLQKDWGGMDLTDWVGMFLGRTVTPLTTSNPPFWQANYVQRQVWFSSFHLSNSTVELYLKEITRRKLKFVEGYPSTLYIVAKYLVDRGRSLPMKAVFSSSETLLDIQRETIEAAFQAPLFDFYGHAERAAFAIECGQGEGKHVVEPFGHVEVVNQDGEVVRDGEMGYLVSTSLQNTAMPLLRYLTSDMTAIIPEPCPCGRTFQRIRNIATKAEDIVVLPDGRWISPSILTHPFKPYPQIRKSQVVQEERDLLRVLIVAGPEFTSVEESGLREALQGRLGSDVQVKIERVADIPREKSGKYRWVISKVRHNLDLKWQ